MALADSVELAERIKPLPASSVAELAVKFDALSWSQFHEDMTDSIDAVHLEHLRAFGHELRLAAAISG